MRLCFLFTFGFHLLNVQAVMRDVQGYHTDTAQRLLKQEIVGRAKERRPTEKTYQHTAASQSPGVIVFDTGPTQPYGSTPITEAITPANRNAPNSATSITDNPSHGLRIYTKSQIQLITTYEKILSSPQGLFESMMNSSLEPEIHLSADATKTSVWLRTLHDNSNQTNTNYLTSADRDPHSPALSASHRGVIDNLAAPVNDNDDRRSGNGNKRGISGQGRIGNGQSVFENDTDEDSVRGSMLTNLCLTCLGNRREMSAEKSTSALSQDGSSMGTPLLVLEFNQFSTSLGSEEEETQTNKVTAGRNVGEYTTANSSQPSSYNSQSFSQISALPTETHTTESDSPPLAEMSVATAPAKTEKHGYIIETFDKDRLGPTPPIYFLSKPLYTVRKPEKDAEQESSMMPQLKRISQDNKNNKNASHSLSISVKKDQALNFINNKWIVTKAEEREGFDHTTTLHVTEAQGAIMAFNSRRQKLSETSTLIHASSSKRLAKTSGMGLLGGTSTAAKLASEDQNFELSTTQSSLKPPLVDSQGAEEIGKSVMSPFTKSSFDFDALTTPPTRNVFVERTTIRKLSGSQSTTDSFLDASLYKLETGLARRDGDAIKQPVISGAEVGDRNEQAMMATEGKMEKKIQDHETEFERGDFFTLNNKVMILINEEETFGERLAAVKQGKEPRVEIMDLIEGINKTNLGVKRNESSVEKKHFTKESPVEDRGEETQGKEDIKNKVEIGKEDMTNVPTGPTTKSKELNTDRGHTAANLSSLYNSLIKKVGAPEHKDIHAGINGAQILEIKNKMLFSDKVTRQIHSRLTSPSSQLPEMTAHLLKAIDLQATKNISTQVSHFPFTIGMPELTQTSTNEASLVNSTVSVTSPPRVMAAGLSSYQPQFTVNTSALDASIIHSALDHGNKSDTTATSAERELAKPTKTHFEFSVKVSLISQTVNISRLEIYNESSDVPPTVKASMGQAKGDQGHSGISEIHRPTSSDMTTSQSCSFKPSGKIAYSDTLHTPADENELRSAHRLMLSMSPEAKNNQFPRNGTSQRLNLTLVLGDTFPATYGLTISAMKVEEFGDNSAVEYASISNSPMVYSDMTNKSIENGREETTAAPEHSDIMKDQIVENILQNPSSTFIAQVISTSVYHANMADRLNLSSIHKTDEEVKNNTSNHGDEIIRDRLNKTNKSVTDDQTSSIFYTDNYKDIKPTSMFAIHASHKSELTGNEDSVPVMNGSVIPALNKNHQLGISAFVDSQPTIPANDVPNNAILSNGETQAKQIQMLGATFMPRAPLPSGHPLFISDLQRVRNMSLQQVSEKTDSISTGLQITTAEMDDYVSLAGKKATKKHIVSTESRESAASTSEAGQIATEKSSKAAHGQHIVQANNHTEAFSVKQLSTTPTFSKHTPAAPRNNSGGMKTENVKQPPDEMLAKTIEHSWPAVHSMIAITHLVNNPDRGVPAALLGDSFSSEYGTLETPLTTQASPAQHHRTPLLPVHIPNQLVAVTNSLPPTEFSPTEMINRRSCKTVGCAESVQNTKNIIGAGEIDGSTPEQMFETRSVSGKDHLSGKHTSLDIEEELQNWIPSARNTAQHQPSTLDKTTLLPVSQSDPGQNTAIDTTRGAAKSVTKAYSGDGDREGHRTLSVEGATQRHLYFSIVQRNSPTEINVFKPAHSTEENTKKAAKGQTLSGHADMRSVKEEEILPKLPLLKPGPESDLKSRRSTLQYPYLPGVSEVSDDVCGSGNYTAEMSVDLGRAVEPGDAIPALGNLRVVINLKTNNSRVNLQVTSCCLSPNVQGNFNNSTCCLFSRLPAEPVGITLLPSALSSSASFTISLFRMINYSMAYLHCDVSVCLRNHSGCERQCLQQRNSYSLEGPDVVVTNLRNRISFGPMLKEVRNSTFPQEIEAAELDLALVLISLMVGMSLVSVMLLVVWLAFRRRAVWPLMSPAMAHACCGCPSRPDRDDLILP